MLAMPTASEGAPSGRVSDRCGAWRRQDHKVLHTAAEHRTDEDPERARQIAELRRERRADQRTGAGDGGEVVAEYDPLVGRHEVAAVVEAFRRRGAGGSITSTFAAMKAL
jgi:hypothetical protein